MATYGVSPEDGGLQSLFESSPAPEVAHTSAAAETGFLLGLGSLLAAPFSVMQAMSLGAGALGVFFGLVGVATTSRPHVAGRVLVPLALLFSFTALLLVGLRYLGLDTAFGDALVPTVRAWLEDLNGYLPEP